MDTGREDWRLVGNKAGPTRLGFALLLTFFELEARFPSSAKELPPAARDVCHPAGRGRAQIGLFLLEVGV